jgi:hypothetical protein
LDFTCRRDAIQPPPSDGAKRHIVDFNAYRAIFLSTSERYFIKIVYWNGRGVNKLVTRYHGFPKVPIPLPWGESSRKKVFAVAERPQTPFFGIFVPPLEGRGRGWGDFDKTMNEE